MTPASVGLFTLLVLISSFQLIDGVSFDEDLRLTLTQKKTLDKFKQRMLPHLPHDYMKQDIYLIRWLRARNYNLNSAEIMLKENIKWRREHKMDTILKENWSDMEKDFHATMDTYDRESRPIGVIDIYSWDIRRAALQGKGPRLVRYLDYLMENLTMQVFERQASGMNVTQWKVLGNADSFNLIEHGCVLCLPLWIQVVQTLENHHPGWIDELIVIDAPSTINVILEAIRPFLSSHTREALKIFSPNRSKWMPYLEKRIEKSERRPQYGGTKPPVDY